jgi:hypothetical protein
MSEIAIFANYEPSFRFDHPDTTPAPFSRQRRMMRARSSGLRYGAASVVHPWGFQQKTQPRAMVALRATRL